LLSKFKQIEPYLEPPYVVETKQQAKKSAAAEPEEDEEQVEAAVEKVAATKDDGFQNSTSPRELFEYVLEQGKKGFIIQRYKGLGEMSSQQLWETTMDPERRTLLSVKLEDIAETETIFSTLMGEDVEARRKFIEDNALDVKNLDI